MCIRDSNRATLENFFKEHIAECSWKLIDKTSDTEIIIAYNSLFCIEYLTNLKSDLCLFIWTSKVLNALNRSSYTDNTMCVKFARKSIYNRACELLKVFRICFWLNFFDKCYIRFVDIDNEIFAFIREEVLNDIVSRNIVLRDNLDAEAYTSNFGIETKFFCL